MGFVLLKFLFSEEKKSIRKKIVVVITISDELDIIVYSDAYGASYYTILLFCINIEKITKNLFLFSSEIKVWIKLVIISLNDLLYINVFCFFFLLFVAFFFFKYINFFKVKKKFYRHSFNCKMHCNIFCECINACKIINLSSNQYDNL